MHKVLYKRSYFLKEPKSTEMSRGYRPNHSLLPGTEKQTCGEYTANSITVVPKKREKVEYERKRLIGRLVLFPNTSTFIGFSLSLKLYLAFL